MGLEANAELERVARRFQGESEALRGLVVRLGYGNLIEGALEAVEAGEMGAVPNGFEPPEMKHSRGHAAAASSSSTAVPVPSPAQHPPQFSNLQAPPGSVNPNMLDPVTNGSARSNGRDSGTFVAPAPPQSRGTDSMNVRWNESPGDASQLQHPQQLWQSMPLSQRARSNSQQQQQQQNRNRASSNSGANSLLSLNLSGGVPADNPSPRATPGGRTPGGGRGNNGGSMTPGTFNSLMGMLNNQQQHQQQQQQQHHHGHPAQQHQQQTPQQPSPGAAGGGGSAFIKGNTPGGGGGGGQSGQGQGHFPFAHRPHQNDALLNPNPIPFALNLSNAPAPDQSWWDRNGGGMFGSDAFLDEKAQMVASAQAHAGQQRSLSPFDITSFLTSGMTPGSGMGYGVGGGGFGMPEGFTPALAQNNMDPMSQAGEDLKGNGKQATASTSQSGSAGGELLGAPALGPSEHIQTFLRLLERQAIRAGSGNVKEEAGRSTPWMDMGSDVSSSSDEDARRSSESNPSMTSSSSTSSGGGLGGNSNNNGSSKGAEMITPNAAYSRLAQHPAFLRTDARELEEMVSTIRDAAHIAAVHAQGSGSGAPLQLNASVLDGMWSLLDKKRYGGGGGNGGNGGGPRSYAHLDGSR